MRAISFTLPFALVPLNRALRTHWAERAREQKVMHGEVLAALRGPRHFPRPPFEKARVTVTRYGLRDVDLDGLYGGAKALVDLLKLRSERNPLGLSLMIDDSPDRCELVARQARPGDGVPRTEVEIEELAYVPPEPRARRGKKVAA